MLSWVITIEEVVVQIVLDNGSGVLLDLWHICMCVCWWCRCWVGGIVGWFGEECSKKKRRKAREGVKEEKKEEVSRVGQSEQAERM